jgi:hypothetical protein
MWGLSPSVKVLLGKEPVLQMNRYYEDEKSLLFGEGVLFFKSDDTEREKAGQRLIINQIEELAEHSRGKLGCFQKNPHEPEQAKIQTHNYIPTKFRKLN